MVSVRVLLILTSAKRRSLRRRRYLLRPPAERSRQGLYWPLARVESLGPGNSLPGRDCRNFDGQLLISAQQRDGEDGVAGKVLQ